MGESEANLTRVYDVIVVGGGISGLSSAKFLYESGLDVLVLEAQDRVGGRTHTIRDPKVNYTDVGGAYVGPTQRRVARMAKELGLEFYKVHHKQKSVHFIEGTWRAVKSTIPPIFNPITVLDMNNMEYSIQSMVEQVPKEAPWKAPKAAEWDSKSVKQFLDEVCWTKTCKFLGRLMVVALLCQEPEEVSLLHMLWYIATNGGITRIVRVTHGAQERKFVGGAQSLSERMADRLGERVKLSSPVVNIRQTDEGVTVTTKNSKMYQGKHVISAMPMALLNRVTFEPTLPSLKLQLIQRMPMGSIIKTMMFYDKTYWRDKGLCGEIVTDQSPIMYCLDDTKPDGTFPCLMGFILADDAREMVNMTEEQRKQAIAEHYARVFKCDSLRKPVHYVEKNWMAEEYSGGCYVSVYPPGVLTRFGKVIKEPFGRVYWASTETATEWAGYMDGAIQAGERAAREILYSLGKIRKSEIEQDEPFSDNLPESPVRQDSVRLLPTVGQFLCAVGAAGVGLAAWAVQHWGIININIYKI